jgi:hypothetical protein
LPHSWAVGLWFTAGRRKCWGEPGRLPGRGRLRAPHPVHSIRGEIVVLTLPITTRQRLRDIPAPV